MFFKSINFSISIPLLLLLSIGILIIYSSSPNLALSQFMFALIGLLIYFLISNFDYLALRNFSLPAFVFIFIILIILAVAGIEVRGVIRWIPVWFFNIQPAELAKPLVIFFLAFFWSNNYPTWSGLFKSSLYVGPLTFLIFIQPALGSALTIMAVWVFMLLATNISWKKILILGIITLIILPLGWNLLKDYQKQRISSFISPETDPLGQGYNLIQSTITVGSGQLFGRGLGYGTQSRLLFLPEGKTDFIFASIAEEFGFIGALSLIGIYFFLIGSCFNIAHSSADYFGYLLSIGVASILLFQVGVNIGMNIGLLPITGITLPLVSYGGSSLIATMISLGLVASVANKAKNR